MANGIYSNGRDQFRKGTVLWKPSGEGGTTTIRTILIDTGAYTVDLANDASLADVPAGARMAVSGDMTLLNPTAGNGGWCDAADVTFTAITTTATVEALVVYWHGVAEAFSPLLAYIDTVTSGLPIPILSTATNKVISWGTRGIFRV